MRYVAVQTLQQYPVGKWGDINHFRCGDRARGWRRGARPLPGVIERFLLDVEERSQRVQDRAWRV